MSARKRPRKRTSGGTSSLSTAVARVLILEPTLTPTMKRSAGWLVCVCVCFEPFFPFFFFIKKTQYPRQIRALNPTLNLAATDGEELNECYGLRHDNASEKRHQIEREVEKARVKDLDPLDAAVEAGGEMGMFFFFFFFFF